MWAGAKKSGNLVKFGGFCAGKIPAPSKAPTKLQRRRTSRRHVRLRRARASWMASQEGGKMLCRTRPPALVRTRLRQTVALTRGGWEAPRPANMRGSRLAPLSCAPAAGAVSRGAPHAPSHPRPMSAGVADTRHAQHALCTTSSHTRIRTCTVHRRDRDGRVDSRRAAARAGRGAWGRMLIDKIYMAFGILLALGSRLKQRTKRLRNRTLRC